MNITEIFIRRPVMTTLIMLAILLFGIIGFTELPVSDLPNVDFPTIQVSASLPGANPETMASSVATPLERQFSTISGLDSITSTNWQGGSQITLQFDLDRNIDAAAQDVQSAIAASAKRLPPNLPSPPSYSKVNPALSPILNMALDSPTLPLSVVDDYAETLVAPRISMVNGVAEVQVNGAQKYAVRVQLDPKILASRKIAIDDVVNAIQAKNVNLPTGTLWGHDRALVIQTNGQLTQAAGYRNLIVTYRDGSPVRLGELGRVIDGVEDNRTVMWYSERRAINLGTQRQPGTNTVEVVDAIKKILPSLRAQLPAAVNLDIILDNSIPILNSVHEVEFTLMLTACLVILVIFLFLRNFSSTVIPSLALPMSIVGTFAAMFLLGYSLDNLSLMALTLSVGFVVDDAIVMLENIVRHMEMGEGVLEAALSGSKEVGFTILSMTLSLAAVFIPVLFMGGILGKLLHEFAVTMGMAILISGFVSLSLTPMLCSRFLRPLKTEKHGWLYNVSERGFESMLRAYDWSLSRVLRFRLTTFLVSLVILVATIYLFIVIPKGFLPDEDNGEAVGTVEAEQGISFDAMVRHQQEVNAIVLANPNVRSITSYIGGVSGGGLISTGRVRLHLAPRAERHQGVDEILQDLRPKLSKIPGVRVYLRNLPTIQIGGYSTSSAYQFSLQDTNTQDLYRYAPILQAKMRGVPGIQDVTSDLQIKNPQIDIEIDRDKAAALGVEPSEVENTLYAAYASRQVSTIYAPNSEYQVITEIEPEYQLDQSALSMLYIRSSSGTLVPLNVLAKLSRSVGPLTVNHLGQLPTVTISFNLKPGVALGDAMTTVTGLARETLPPSISTSFQGEAQAFQSSQNGLGLLLVMAILVIYIILGILYESFIHPLTILSGLPSAGLGALLTLMIFHVELNMYSFVGIIMLIGIVKKNAIMMIDFALELQHTEGKTASEAIYQGCLIRFRPIMMTTMAALMGTLPIAVGYGAGGESRRPLGLAVVGGLLISQLITLYITPVYYTYLDSLQRAFRKTASPRQGKTVDALALEAAKE